MLRNRGRYRRQLAVTDIALLLLRSEPGPVIQSRPLAGARAVPPKSGSGARWRALCPDRPSELYRRVHNVHDRGTRGQRRNDPCRSRLDAGPTNIDDPRRWRSDVRPSDAVRRSGRYDDGSPTRSRFKLDPSIHRSASICRNTRSSAKPFRIPCPCATYLPSMAR